MTRKPLPAKKRLLIVEHGLIQSMADDPRFLREFPFLKTLRDGLQKPARGGCGGCGASKARNRQDQLFTQAKQTLASMGDHQKRKLKDLLNAEQVRLNYRLGDRVIQHTF